MNAAEQFRQALRDGRIDVDRLIKLLLSAQQQLQQANRRIEELEKKLGGAPSVRTGEAYSMRAEEQRQEARGKKRRKKAKRGRRGRLTTAEKVARAERTEKVFPRDVPEGECKFSLTRPLWRFENGRTVLIAYEV